VERIAVVGAGLAGLRAAEALRRGGFQGALTVVGDEPHEPYNRPPLSKQFLAGTFDEGKCRFRVKPELGVTWRLGTRAVGLDLGAREVALDDGAALPFDGLVIATGCAARDWPGVPLPPARNVFVLRSIDDAAALRAAAAGAEHVVILGAGFIGMEVAATFRSQGREVDVVDVAPFPLRPLGREVGALCRTLHEERGVRFHMDELVHDFTADGDRLTGVTLRDGGELPCDLLLVATGAAPNVGWLAESGLQLRPAVVCDEHCLAVGAEGVAAAGDVAQWPHPLAGGDVVSVEHWSNAAEMAHAAAGNLLAAPEGRRPYTTVPSFWSDQYDVKVQSVGFPARAERIHVLEGSIDERRFVAACERDERVVGAIMWAMPRRMPAYRRLIEDAPLLDDLRGRLEEAAPRPAG
jgi:NADPH-dependent 2,4-dienoyl-CoA reductase/sulfur reductase-like enzyme